MVSLFISRFDQIRFWKKRKIFQWLLASLFTIQLTWRLTELLLIKGNKCMCVFLKGWLFQSELASHELDVKKQHTPPHTVNTVTIESVTMVRESDLTLHSHRRRGHMYTNTPKPNGGQAFNLKLLISNCHNVHSSAEVQREWVGMMAGANKKWP